MVREVIVQGESERDELRRSEATTNESSRRLSSSADRRPSRPEGATGEARLSSVAKGRASEEPEARSESSRER